MPSCLLQRADFAPHLLAQLAVERGERFVEQQHGRIDDEAPRERDALLLPAGKLAWQPVLEAVQMQERQHVAYPHSDRRLLDMPQREAERHVLPHRHVREQRKVLKDHPDAAPMRWQQVCDLAVDRNRACVDGHEARDRAQRRGLAAPRGAEQADEFAGHDVERDAAHDRLAAVRDHDPVEPDLALAAAARFVVRHAPTLPACDSRSMPSTRSMARMPAMLTAISTVEIAAIVGSLSVRMYE